jgi:hypothetical protein
MDKFCSYPDNKLMQSARFSIVLAKQSETHVKSNIDLLRLNYHPVPRKKHATFEIDMTPSPLTINQTASQKSLHKMTSQYLVAQTAKYISETWIFHLLLL